MMLRLSTLSVLLFTGCCLGQSLGVGSGGILSYTDPTGATCTIATAPSIIYHGGVYTCPNGFYVPPSAPSTLSSISRTTVNRADDVINVKDFGAIGTNTATTISSALGITTLTGLHDFTASNGSHPYVSIGTANYENYRIFSNPQIVGSASNQIVFNYTITVGVAGAISGSTTIPVVDMPMLGVLRDNMPCSGTGIAANTKISLLNPAASKIVLTNATTGALASGATFVCRWDTSAVPVGAAIGGTGVIPGGTTVTVNDTTTGTITLSANTTGTIGVGKAIEIQWTYTDAQIAAATMDWLGIQAALINAKTGTSNGADVYIPRGLYLINLPLVQPNHSSFYQVSMHGEGEEATIIKVNVDLGFGAYALACEKRITGSPCDGVWRDFTLNGNAATFGVGFSSNNNDGIGWNSHRIMKNVQVQHFRTCLAITGDQTPFEKLDLNDCWYGIEFDYVNANGQFGNKIFTKVGMGSFRMAGFAAGPTTGPDQERFVQSICAGGPYCFVKETGGTNNTGLLGMVFDSLQAENIGNSMFSDDHDATHHVALNFNNIWTNFQPLWSSGASLPGTSPSAIFDFASCDRCEIHATSEPTLWTPGQNGIFNITNTSGFLIAGDLDDLISEANGGGGNLPSLWSSYTQTLPALSSWTLKSDAGWSGYPYPYIGAHATGTCMTTAGVCAGTNTEAFIGISVGINNPISVIADRGIINAIAGTTISAAGVPARTYAGGTISDASSATDNTSVIIGTILSTGTVGNLVKVRLNSPYSVGP